MDLEGRYFAVSSAVVNPMNPLHEEGVKGTRTKTMHE
jgi:hypothetical protein